MNEIRIELANETTALVEKMVSLGCDRLLAFEAVSSIFDDLGTTSGYGDIPGRWVRINKQKNRNDGLNNNSGAGNDSNS
jgi:hypothetical protein